MTKEEIEKEAEEKYSEVDREFIACQDEGEVFNIGYILGAEPREKRIAELEEQIEKMKCCGNCRFSESDKLNGTFCHREGCFVVASAKCKLWEN